MSSSSDVVWVNAPPLPIFFWKTFQAIPNAVLSALGLPTFSYDDGTSPYTVNKLSLWLFGVGAFHVMAVAAVAFFASVILVSVVLPHIYFRLMLLTDRGTKTDYERINEVQALVEKSDIDYYYDYTFGPDTLDFSLPLIKNDSRIFRWKPQNVNQHYSNNSYTEVTQEATSAPRNST